MAAERAAEEDRGCRPARSSGFRPRVPADDGSSGVMARPARAAKAKAKAAMAVAETAVATVVEEMEAGLEATAAAATAAATAVATAVATAAEATAVGSVVERAVAMVERAVAMVEGSAGGRRGESRRLWAGCGWLRAASGLLEVAGGMLGGWAVLETAQGGMLLDAVSVHAPLCDMHAKKSGACGVCIFRLGSVRLKGTCTIALHTVLRAALGVVLLVRVGAFLLL